jgi:hypothetical protein
MLVLVLAIPLVIAACDGDDDVVVTPVPPPGTAVSSTGVWVVADNGTLPADNVAAFIGDNTYYNVHSAAFPNGEIRGQLDFTPTVVKLASLNGAQDNTASAARGAGVLAFNAADNTIAGFVVTSGVTGTAAHIHQGARGVNGGILITLVGGPSHWFVPDNTTLPADNVAAFLGDNTYFNVHSAAFPNGEIRGQIDKTPTTTKFASLNGAQDNTASAAKGAGILGVDGTLVDNNIAGFVVTTNITGTVAHIHVGAARGATAPAVVTLVGGPSHWFVADNATLSADNVVAFLADNTYYNVHTAAFPNGEIRGQLDKTPNLTKFASLSGAQEVPANASAARGGGFLGFDGTLVDNNIAGFVVTTGITGTAAHVHQADRGINGGILVPLLPAP